jgi:hypothetical protein
VLDDGGAALSPPQPPSLREGGDSYQGGTDSFEHGARLMQGLVVGEAKHEDAAFPEEGVAKSIPSLTPSMRWAIDLDCELCRSAEEVGEVAG